MSSSSVLQRPSDPSRVGINFSTLYLQEISNKAVLKLFVLDFYTDCIHCSILWATAFIAYLSVGIWLSDNTDVLLCVVLLQTCVDKYFELLSDLYLDIHQMVDTSIAGKCE